MQEKWNIFTGIDQVEMATFAQHHKIQSIFFSKISMVSSSGDRLSDDRQTASIAF